jgi:hypothetical protein
MRRALDGDARNVINARRTSKTDERAAAGYHPRRGGCYDSDEDRSPTPEPPWTRVFSREIRAEAFPQRFRQPTTIVKYNGETDPACGSTITAWRSHQRRGHHPQPAPTPRRFSPDVARAPARQLDPQLGQSGPHVRGQLPGHIRAPWKLLGPTLLHPEARRVAPGLHTVLLQALYGAP